MYYIVTRRGKLGVEYMMKPAKAYWTYAKAEKLLGEEHNCCKILKSERLVPMLPKYIGKLRTGIKEVLDVDIGKYTEWYLFLYPSKLAVSLIKGTVQCQWSSIPNFTFFTLYNFYKPQTFFFFLAKAIDPAARSIAISYYSPGSRVNSCKPCRGYSPDSRLDSHFALFTRQPGQ